MDLLDRFKEEKILVSPKVINSFSGDVDSFIGFIKSKPDVNFVDEGVLDSFYSFLNSGFSSSVNLISNYSLVNESRDLSNWVGYYNNRYEVLSSVLSKRVELSSVISVSRVDKIINRDSFGLIGLVSDFRETSNGNIMIDLEDPSGSVSLLVNKSSPAFASVGELVRDEVIGVNVRKSGRWCFVDSIIFPEIPFSEVKKCDDDSCAVFISDTHVGSNNFLPDNFQRFIDWLRGERGSDSEKALAGKVKYLFFVGDLVDGVGVYPDQDNELVIKDIFKQYEEVSRYIKQVPSDIKIIVSPGNHDACRLALPEPPMINEFTKSIQLPNVIMVSNPALVNIHTGKGFSGHDVLLYHGNSFDHFIGEVPRLRKLGYEKPEAVMEFLLRKRHLSPTHGASLVAPSKNDFLLINKVPDVFASGHLHQLGVSSYKGVTLINSSCFQGQSAFMKRLGINPNHSKVPVMSLSNKKVHVMDFST